MQLIRLALKNATGNRWRALALGLFIFLVSFILLIFNAFFTTAMGNMENALINSLTGHVQVRSTLAQEEDMMAMLLSWEELHFITFTELDLVQTAFAGHGLKAVPRVRVNIALTLGLEQQFAMAVGLDPADTQYSDAFTLDSGDYLQPGNPGQILLSSVMANNLDAKVGDQVLAVTEYGMVELTVMGVGDVDMLSMFGFMAVYTDIHSARQLAGFAQGEVTDVIGFLPAGGSAATATTALSAELNGLRISHWEAMGGFVIGLISMYRAMFLVFMLVMMIIISILIINLILLMGIERREEIGTLRAIGYSKLQVVQIFLAEIMSIAVIFAALGLGAGSAVILALTGVGFEVGPPTDYIMGRLFFFRYDISLIYPVAATVLAFALAAALWPAWIAAAQNPVETLKEQ